MEASADESRAVVSSSSAGQANSAFIYFVGSVLYAVLCMPAFGHRGFPPIDPVWRALTFLWVAPILVATMLNDRPLQRRLSALFCYSMVTAFGSLNTPRLFSYGVARRGSANTTKVGED